MAYPVLAAQNTWFAPTVSTIAKVDITEIEIMDSYTPDSSVTVVDSWDASATKDGSITCYVIGTKIIIAGNGSGKIAMNPDSSMIFYNFAEVLSITGLELLDSSEVTNILMAFNSCKKVQSLNIGTWDVSKVENAIGLFGQCYLLESVDNISVWDVSNMTMVNQMFYYCKSLTTIDLSRWNINSIKSLYAMFFYCENLTTVNISNWDVSTVTLFDDMFCMCTSLKTVHMDNWKFGSASCCNMFQADSALQTLDVSHWDVANVPDMSVMFYQCSSLGEIDVSNWDVSKVTNLDHFAAHANLKRKGMEKWDTRSLINANAAFHNCAEEELDLSGWDVSKVQFFCQMFENSPNLKRIKGLDKWDTSSGIGFDEMFGRCSKLEELDLFSFNTTKAKNGTSASTNGHKTATLKDMFASCNNLKKVKVGANFSINGDGSNTTAANKAILPTPSTDYITGADGNWYTINGDSYAPNAMKDKTTETYYASYDIVADIDVIVKNGSLLDAAKAIREKNGMTNRYTPAQFGAAIRALS